MALIRISTLTKDLSMETSLTCPLKRMGKNDQIVAAQADKPTNVAMSIERGNRIPYSCYNIIS